LVTCSAGVDVTSGVERAKTSAPRTQKPRVSETCTRTETGARRDVTTPDGVVVVVTVLVVVLAGVDVDVDVDVELDVVVVVELDVELEVEPLGRARTGHKGPTTTDRGFLFMRYRAVKTLAAACALAVLALLGYFASAGFGHCAGFTKALRQVRQSTTCSGNTAPSAKRSSRYGARSTGGSSSTSSCATALPTAGDCMNPCPENPHAT